MACEVCEHCDTSIPTDQETECQGHSYHSQCRKCYVCSETNLRDAEIFKGVIFCYECSKTIFQGCVTTRRAKTRLRSKSQKDRGHMKRKGHRRRVLEKLTTVHNICDSSKEPSILSPVNTSSYIKDKPYIHSEEGDLKKSSTDKNISTVITQDLLEKLNQPTETGDIIPLPKKKLESSKEVRMKHKSTDLSVAELGASVEIAHIGLRRHSELPVIIKSVSAAKPLKSKSALVKKPRKSDITTKSSSTFDQKDQTLSCTNRRVVSVLKMPYKCFKKSILDRSSYISMMLRLEGKGCTRGTLRRLFQDEIHKHHRGGMKALYSTINRTEVPYKLGWLKTSRHRNIKRCKHYLESHSYRCLRSHVMRLAGPTSSELAVIRKKLKDFITTDFTTKMITKEANSKHRTYEKPRNTCNITND